MYKRSISLKYSIGGLVITMTKAERLMLVGMYIAAIADVVVAVGVIIMIT